MTVAVYLSPRSGSAPFMVTDTLVSTYDGQILGNVATRQRSGFSSISTDLHSLARKTIFIGDTLLAFAGCVKDILDFLEYAEASIDLGNERPFRRLAERANEYKSRNLSVLALLVDGDRIHKVLPGIEHEHDNLGFYRAVGSGADDVIKQIQETLDRNLYENVDDSRMAYAIANELVVSALVKEIYGTDNVGHASKDWGGILEYVFYNPNAGRWQRQPPTAYFIYQLDLDTNSGPQLVDRIFLYEPGVENGWLHAIRSAPDIAYNISYRISSLALARSNVEIYPWQDWKPKRLSLSLAAGHFTSALPKAIKVISSIVEIDEFNGVDRFYGRSGFRLVPFGEKLESFLTTEAANFRNEG